MYLSLVWKLPYVVVWCWLLLLLCWFLTVMLGPWGQTGLKSNILASASALASSIWPQPGQMYCRFVLLTWSRKCAIQCKMILVVSISWLYHHHHHHFICSDTITWNNSSKHINMSRTYQARTCTYGSPVTVCAQSKIIATFITKTWLSTLMWDTNSVCVVDVVAMCSYSEISACGLGLEVLAPAPSLALWFWPRTRPQSFVLSILASFNITGSKFLV